MTAAHVAELELRRLRAGEAVPADVPGHAAGCAECQAKLAELEAEQRRFEEEIPFERFAAGVERAARSAERRERPSEGRAAVLYRTLGMAVAAALVLVVGRPLMSRHPYTGVKGGADIFLRIAGPEGGPQRFASPNAPEALAPGERVRIGYKPGPHHYVASVSIDETGQVTPLYPEYGQSLPADVGDATYYLPDSLEFTGKGAERVVVVLSDQPLPVDALVKAAREAYADGHGDVAHLPPLKVAGEQFDRVLLKP